MKKRCLHNKATVNEYIMFIFAEVLFVVLILWALLSYVDSIEEDTLYEKNYLSRDVALLVDSIYSSPGNVYYPYIIPKIDLSKFGFLLKDQRVNVLEKGGAQQIKFPYSDDLVLSDKLSESVSDSEILHFSKVGNEISIANDAPNLKILKCSNVDVEKKSPIITISLMPQDEEITNIAKQIKSIEPLSDFKFKATTIEYDLTQQKKNLIIGNGKFDILLGLKTGNKENTVRAFTGKDEKSKKLGCYILNELLKKYPEIEIANIPSEKSRAESFVILELNNLVKNKNPVIIPIINGIKEYYG